MTYKWFKSTLKQPNGKSYIGIIDQYNNIVCYCEDIGQAIDTIHILRRNEINV